ncbi:metal ABC transporter solute-binding protein, Zn/Mn family [Paenibacillus lignilyticus]|uniref:Zinc ABC transporter substrate-binding protein n=1 Tax=Paenibacillus lignilyticus TaxID=1172615 RepID=A0ABS5CEU1_9BACL|nr:zinc ABC transporter substrate-binding protein [Paenibacillus lignilyticus]MBP3964340.1 zinc ABC transporter substrate-binding protein [Paenibacillus lignilyticus]
MVLKLFRPMALSAITLAFLVFILAGCGSASQGKLVEGKLNVVTSFYPLYFLAEQIGGSGANVINMIPAGVEPHDWSPKSRDLDTASKAQLFLYNGAGLEGWVDDFLQGLPSDTKLMTVEASKDIVKISGNPEGHDDDHDDDEHSHHVDPHTWVSPKSMLIMAKTVLDQFVAADQSHKSDYEANYAKLQTKLTELDDSYTKALNAAPRKDIVTSHQAFGYLARDYGLKQVAIMGLSPDAEPKAQDLLRIAKYVKDNGIKYIFFEELVSDELAKTLAREANVSTMVLNPLEGLTPEQEAKGEDYFSLMKANLQNLVQALQ